jgi:carbon storage regulator
MLILTRRLGEGFLVGHDIEIVVLGLDGSHVRVGIRAPREIPVLRKELLRQVEQENWLAAGSGQAVLQQLSRDEGRRMRAED